MSILSGGCGCRTPSGSSSFLWLVFIKQRYLTFEAVNDFVKQGMSALYNNSHIVLFWFSVDSRGFHIGCFHDIFPPLFISVEPTQEKTGPLCLLPIVSAAHIKQDVRVHTEKLFNNANDSLGNFYVTGRFRMTIIGQVEPIAGKEWIIVLLKVNDIAYARLSLPVFHTLYGALILIWFTLSASMPATLCHNNAIPLPVGAFVPPPQTLPAFHSPMLLCALLHAATRLQFRFAYVCCSLSLRFSP